jgi:hypothetical protein
MSEFYHATNPSSLNDVARVHAVSKSSNGQNGEQKYVVRVIVCLWMARYWPFTLSLVRHKEVRCGEEVILTEAANGADND